MLIEFEGRPFKRVDGAIFYYGRAAYDFDYIDGVDWQELQPYDSGFKKVTALFASLDSLYQYQERAKSMSFEALAYTLQDIAATIPLHAESTDYARKLANELEAYGAEYARRVRNV